VQAQDVEKPATKVEEKTKPEQPPNTDEKKAAVKKADENDIDKPKRPLAVYLTVTSPLDDKVFRNVRNAALSLQKQATNEDRKAYLFLQIKPGQSEAYQAVGLAKFLTSAEISRVTTVAWIPETVTGHIALLALGCKEIIMHPDAMLGDIGRGKTADADDRLAALAIVDKRHNRLLNRAIAEAMVDPNKKLYYVTLEQPNQPKETRIATQEDLELLRNNHSVITDVQILKEAGEPGKFSGSQARSLEFLTNHIARSVGDIAEIYGIDPENLREDPTRGEAVKVRLIKITETIDPVLEAFVERQIQRALSSGANTLIFEIHSPGGYLISAQSLANYLASLSDQKVRTIAYIPEFAYSGAALIALGCDEIYMAKEGQIGDAGAIQEVGKEGKFEHVPEKLLGPYRVTLRTLAEKKQRPPAIAEAMAFKELVVYQVTHRDNGRVWYMSESEIHDSNGEWIKGAAVPESGNNQLLVVTGERAVELKVARAVVKNLDDLRIWLNIPADVRIAPVGRTWIDTFVFILANPVVTGFLFFVGLFCLYLELHIFSGFFAIISAVCFGIFFWSRFLGGTAGWLEVILFTLGMLFLGLEIFVIPGFGVFGVSGILLIVGSLIMASQTFNNIEPSADLNKLAQSLSGLAGSLLAVFVMGMLLQHYLPRIPILNTARIIPPGGIGLDEDAPRLKRKLLVEKENLEKSEFRDLMGQQGVATTMLRPSGRARFHDQLVDVVTEGSFIAEKTPVEVIRIAGHVITVREVT
jgi:membrane-bound serine protease (ClpP class)